MRLKIILVLIALVAIALWFSTRPPENTTVSTSAAAPLQEPKVLQVSQNATPAYVGRQTCIGCHEKENALWTDSHHDLAMQEASAASVLGNFDNATFDYYGSVTRFYRKGESFYVNTDGVDGEPTDFEIKYVFGVTPLQQYLIELPGGRLQALSIAWDSREAAEGGQKWFHLYADEHITFDDELHWTSVNHNWNYMCAECHTTNLQKNFDADSNSYHTTWSEIDVSCEACHGPASLHLEWAKSSTGEAYDSAAAAGLQVQFNKAQPDSWKFSADANIAELQGRRDSTTLIDTCARCHSRRASMNTDRPYAHSLHDSHLLSMLEPGLYHADGQIDDEVYVYGSFIQSKMYRAGVSCNDCHNVHSLKLRAEGNELCLQCHKQANYDVSSHHFHTDKSSGSQCIACHMPDKNYMVVDNRHDHSFRVPRPDLSISTGAPNACTQCHQQQSNEWALTNIKQWYGREKFSFHYGEALHAGRMNAENAEALLLMLIKDSSQPAIARASAISLLQNYPGTAALQVIQQSLAAGDPLLRISALGTLDMLPVEERYKIAGKLLDDPLKAVRILAASKLAAMPRAHLSNKQNLQLELALAEYIAVQKGNADRAFAHVNLGNLYIELGKYPDAERAYKKAIDIEAHFIPASINLADLYRLQDREADAESSLRQGLQLNPGAAALHHALGLSLVRQKRYEEALLSLKSAATLEAGNAQYNLVYAIALHSSGASQAALDVLQAAHLRNPANQQLLMPLITINQELGNLTATIHYAEKLLQLSPENQSIRDFLKQIRP